MAIAIRLFKRILLLCLAKTPLKRLLRHVIGLLCLAIGYGGKRWEGVFAKNSFVLSGIDDMLAMMNELPVSID